MLKIIRKIKIFILTPEELREFFDDGIAILQYFKEEKRRIF
jgi:hypothetical protein